MHGIMENDYMFSGKGEVPWHGIGTVLDGVLTSDEEIKEARLAWLVEQTPVFTANNWAQPISARQPIAALTIFC